MRLPFMLALTLVTTHSHAFEIISGACQLDTPGTGWFAMRTAAICVKQQSSRRGDCTFTAPASLALRVKEFDVRAGDYLRVNGVVYTGTGGPDGIVPSGIVDWHGNATDPGSRFQLCRPLLPRWIYFFLGFSYFFGCCSFFMLFLWSRIITFVVYVFAFLGVMFGLTSFINGYNGYVLQDASFGMVIGNTDFYFDAPAFIWFTTYGFASALVPLSALMFIRMRIKARWRTEQLERELRARIKDGCILLLNVSWLIKQPSDYILQRRQDLPKEALVEPDLALKWLGEGRVGVLSYRWLKAHHPDPDRWHMNAVLGFLRRGFTWADTCSLMLNGGEASLPRALFWDYASLHQKDKDGNKTEEEKEAFKKALDVMTYLYATPSTLVLQHKLLPPDFPRDLPTYENSGWCTMESAAAGLQTEGGGSRYEIGQGWSRLYARDRKTPDQMAAIFRDENLTKFVGNADREDVAKLYAELHHHVIKYDQSRRRCFTTIVDGVIEGFSKGFGIPVEAWVALAWFGYVICFLIALTCMAMPSPCLIVLGCWFVSLFGFVPSVTSRRFRQWHTDKLRMLCCKTNSIEGRLGYAAPASASVAPAPFRADERLLVSPRHAVSGEV